MLKCFLFIRKSLQIFSNQWLVLVIDASKASLTIVAADKMERVSIKGSNQLPLATNDFPAKQKVCPISLHVVRFL